ncbi:hypothetical protein [Streptomyces spiralis]|uniref:hypothetical protein n=1 Tax=Streptomyces spiralis TaxID=66376 RepID=UPI0033CCADD7
MATFNQNNQTVHGDQYMGDTVNVTQGDSSPIDTRAVAWEFDRALAAAQQLEVSTTREQVTAELTAAQAELEAGETTAAQGRLARLVALGGRVAEIVNNVAGAVRALVGG